jgi:outer membrane protein assembly factor BamB
MQKDNRHFYLYFITFCIPLVTGCADAQTASGQDMREWTDATGQYKVVAAFGGIEEGNVKLLKQNGSAVYVPITKFSAADQQYLRTVMQKPVAVSTSAGTGGWTTFLGPNGNNTSAETGLIAEFPPAGPKVLWKTELGSGFSGITIGGGKLYTLYGKDGRELVACFDAKSGQEIWTFDSDADFAEGRSYGPRSTPALDGQQLYTVGASGRVLCLNVNTGKPIWEMNLYEKFSMQPHNEGHSPSPIIDGQNVILAGGSSVFAVKKTNGELVWRALDEQFNHSTPCFATIEGKRQLVVMTGQNVVGIDPSDGTELWRYEQRGVNATTPVVSPNNEIFTAAAYGFGSQLAKISNGSANRVYKNMVLATHHATAILHNGYLYGFHDRPGRLKCVKLSDGEEQWEDRSIEKGKMLMAEGRMYILTEPGKLYIAPVSPAGFETTSMPRVLSGNSFTAPSLLDGILYIRTDKEMAAIDLRK